MNYTSILVKTCLVGLQIQNQIDKCTKGLACYAYSFGGSAVLNAEITLSYFPG